MQAAILAARRWRESADHVRTETTRQAANRSEPRRVVESFGSRSFDAGARGTALTCLFWTRSAMSSDGRRETRFAPKTRYEGIIDTFLITTEHISITRIISISTISIRVLARPRRRRDRDAWAQGARYCWPASFLGRT